MAMGMGRGRRRAGRRGISFLWRIRRIGRRVRLGRWVEGGEMGDGVTGGKEMKRS